MSEPTLQHFAHPEAIRVREVALSGFAITLDRLPAGTEIADGVRTDSDYWLVRDTAGAYQVEARESAALQGYARYCRDTAEGIEAVYYDESDRDAAEAVAARDRRRLLDEADLTGGSVR